MRAKSINYEKLINTGNFTHEKYGIEIELSENEKAEDAIKLAKKFVLRQISCPTKDDRMTASRVQEYDEEGLPF